ncbi:MAG: 16S rRNA (cytosine(1402)-N(4))-methyltransferase RsmH [bacterium]|nr:16S rRNA (cytosine(1402)-N(4))-methyltransferase RsmH [bacterium]
MHKPVLLKEVIEILNPQSGEFFIDGTLGSGGHAVEIIKKISPNGIFLGVDWDKDVIENFKSNLKPKSYNLKAIRLVHGNYADLPEILSAYGRSPEGRKKYKLPKADGLLIDLGFSSEQLEKSGRGFSFLRDEPLDMRYDTKVESLTAAEAVNSFNEKDLADIFWKYGEERFSRRIAKKIVEERKKKRILITFDLVEVIKRAVPKSYEKGRIHPATRVFQALRIYVNDELGNLEKLLKNLEKIIKPKGRVAIISFHSLEDRLVKNYFREMAKPARIATQSVAGGKGMAEILTKKPITATLEEIRSNPRSRSAKMRAIKLL